MAADDDAVGQIMICKRYGAGFVPASLDLKVGIDLNVLKGQQPVNGARHPPAGDTTGWYIWTGGEPSKSADFFAPMHLAHLRERVPRLMQFLALPPGWRFLAADDYEDVWYDPSLLDV